MIIQLNDVSSLPACLRCSLLSALPCPPSFATDGCVFPRRPLSAERSDTLPLAEGLAEGLLRGRRRLRKGTPPAQQRMQLSVLLPCLSLPTALGTAPAHPPASTFPSAHFCLFYSAARPSKVIPLNPTGRKWRRPLSFSLLAGALAPLFPFQRSSWCLASLDCALKRRAWPVSHSVSPPLPVWSAHWVR